MTSRTSTTIAAVDASALPAGAATAVKQDGLDTRLGQIEAAVENAPSFLASHILVVTPGTAVQGATQACAPGGAILVKARDTNTGFLYIGGNAAQAQVHEFKLGPGDAISLVIDNLNLIWVDASKSGDVAEILMEV